MKTLTQPGDFVLYKHQNPYYGVIQVRNYTAEIQGSVVAKEFRWSTDNITFSAWIELTVDNLRNLELDPENEFWIEFRVTLVSGGPVSVGSFDLEVDTKPIDNYKGLVPVKFDCAETGNITSITRIQDLCFQPYEVNPAVCLFNDLSYMVNELFGHQVEYFRAVPDKRAQDISLMEYTLYNVEPAKCIKVLVPNNEFPDSKFNFNPFGIDFEQSFEIHIDKNYWEEIFGVGTGPQKRDIIYFPLSNRVYEVLSSYLFRAFMERDSYWKVSLVKYQPKSNRYEPDSVRQTLDDLTTDVNEQFEKDLREQEEIITKPQQYDYFIGDREYDPSRESLHKDIKVIEKKLVNYSTVISEFHYSLMNLVNYNYAQNPIAVQYRETVKHSDKAERSYSAWFCLKKPNVFVAQDTINSLTLSNNTLTFQISAQRNYAIGDLLKIHRVGGITLYGEIIAINNYSTSTTYDLYIETPVIDAMNSQNPLWTGLSGFKVEKIIPNNFLNGYDTTNSRGIRIDLLADRYFLIRLNTTSYIFAIDSDLERDQWYGVFINISSKFKQINVNLWRRKWIENLPSSPQTTELLNIYNKTMNWLTLPDCSAETKYNLLASNMLITNIRLYDETAEIEKQPLLLNQNIVKDSHRAIIIDNALPRLKIPYIAQSK